MDDLFCCLNYVYIEQRMRQPHTTLRQGNRLKGYITAKKHTKNNSSCDYGYTVMYKLQVGNEL